MKKLFLTSKNLGKLPEFVGKKPGETKMVFIPTASDPYTDKWFVDADRKFFKQCGYSFTEIDLKNQDYYSLSKSLSGIDLIYVSGGNSFYLLEKIRESQFELVITEKISSGTIYAGGSAGAAIASPDISPLALLDDPQKAPNLKSNIGLNFINFVILPHYGKEKYASRYAQIFQEFKDFKHPLVALHDNQAIQIENNTIKIIETL